MRLRGADLRAGDRALADAGDRALREAARGLPARPVLAGRNQAPRGAPPRPATGR